MGDAKKQYLRSGELAGLAGVSTDTLRHYERKGLLSRPRRSANGYREYPTESLDRVRLVRRALEFGFTLDELARILSVRDRGGTPCHDVRRLAETKLTQMETQLEEMTALRDELQGVLKSWDVLLSKNTPPQRARLLESLAASPRGRTKDSGLTRPPINRKKEDKESQL